MKPLRLEYMVSSGVNNMSEFSGMAGVHTAVIEGRIVQVSIGGSVRILPSGASSLPVRRRICSFKCFPKLFTFRRVMLI